MKKMNDAITQNFLNQTSPGKVDSTKPYPWPETILHIFFFLQAHLPIANYLFQSAGTVRANNGEMINN